MITQKNIANLLGITPSLLSMILNGHRRISWANAKKLSELFPGTSPLFFMDASPEELKSALKELDMNAA